MGHAAEKARGATRRRAGKRLSPAGSLSTQGARGKFAQGGCLAGSSSAMPSARGPRTKHLMPKLHKFLFMAADRRCGTSRGRRHGGGGASTKSLLTYGSASGVRTRWEGAGRCDRDQFPVHKFAKSELAQFPTIAGILDAAEWHLGRGPGRSIDEGHAALDS